MGRNKRRELRKFRTRMERKRKLRGRELQGEYEVRYSLAVRYGGIPYDRFPFGEPKSANFMQYAGAYINGESFRDLVSSVLAANPPGTVTLRSTPETLPNPFYERMPK